MKIETRSSVQSTKNQRVLQYIVLPDMKPEVAAYKLTESWAVSTSCQGRQPHEKRGETVKEGFALLSTVLATSQGKDDLPSSVDMPGKERPWLVMATPELLEFWRVHGESWGAEEKNAWFEKHGNFDKPRPEHSETPFTDLAAGASPDLAVFVDWGNHEVFTRTGLPLPWARQFSYISAHMHNGCYNLETAAAILSQREDITLALGRYSKSYIHRIEHYNATAAQTHHLSFSWAPNVEDYRAMVAECERIGGKYPSVNWRQAVFNLDLLGLRAGGAAKYDDFHDSDPEPESEEEDW